MNKRRLSIKQLIERNKEEIKNDPNEMDKVEQRIEDRNRKERKEA